MKTVHLVCNAHLDPVWLWPWSAGLDAAINTSESVCDLLDRHPDIVFTRGEAWFYEQVERTAPRLFRRIQAHVRAGRWEIVGGWYVQPDCNLPGRASFERQIELGRTYFRSRFGEFPRIAYNVDSFGHAATLPDIMAAAGQTHYVMMRPQAHERMLPARLFRWRGAGGAEVATFRLGPEYCTPEGVTWAHIEGALADLPDGVDDTMCFIGVGDHGGGPTEELVQWCRREADRRPDVRLVFSSPRRFFAAVARTRARWPVVTGELQQHAIGCYAVHRRVKTSLRRAENLLAQADRAVKADRVLGRDTAEGRRQAWRWTCFSGFHDTLAGTCLPSAYRQVDWQLGHASATADEVLNLRLRRIMVRLPKDPSQRIVLANFSDRDFDDFVEHEPWLEWTEWRPDWVLVDEKDRIVPCQVMAAEAVREAMVRLVFRIVVPAGGRRVLRIARDSARRTGRRRAAAGPGFIGSQGPMAGARGLWPWLRLRSDPTDTWGHGIDRYAGRVTGQARWSAPVRLESGPLVTCWQVTGRIGASPLVAEWRRYAGGDFTELRLKVDWRERHRVLQLVVPLSGEGRSYRAGAPGGIVSRAADGQELPVHDLVLAGGRRRTGVASPDVFSASVHGGELSLTLLRSCVMAHHDPHPGVTVRREFSDRGEHTFRLRFHWGGGVTTARLAAAAEALRANLRVGDLTFGMPRRPLRGAAQAPALAELQAQRRKGPRS